MNHEPHIQKATAIAWFKKLRDDICDAFETIECDYQGIAHATLPTGKFIRKNWKRNQSSDVSQSEVCEDTGGGETSLLRGRVFEKVGVNISTVHGHFPEDFRQNIPGASENGEFWATGISVVAHMRSPLVPAVHMNTRHIVTQKSWFGGGADLTPMFPESDDAKQDKKLFHGAFKDTCDRHGDDYYEKFSKWCDEYFYLKHRQESRGVGGIFYDYLEKNWDQDFAFTQEVGRTFLSVYPSLVRAHMEEPWTPEQRELQLIKRGRYVEFNLLYDRGTTFGLKTGGNTEAILMSLPPEVKWI